MDTLFDSSNPNMHAALINFAVFSLSATASNHFLKAYLFQE